MKIYSNLLNNSNIINFNNINKRDLIYHDIKNILFAISGYITIGNYKKAQEKIDEICDIIPNSIENKFKNDFFIDNIINSKINYINKLNINFKYKKIIKNKILINKSDLCTIFGNVFDNSIEACEKIDNNKFIKINIFNNKDFLNINICNSSNFKNENLKTTKKNIKFHGLGLKSIKYILKKYDHKLNIIQKNNKFIINIKINYIKR